MTWKKFDFFCDVIRVLIISWLIWNVSVQCAKGQTPAHASAAALADLQAIPAAGRGFIRYLWVHRDPKKTLVAISYAINSISRSSVTVDPVVLHGGQLVRLNLAEIAPQDQDFIDWALVWEGFIQDEPYFTVRTEATVLITAPWWKHKGKWYQGRNVQVAIPAPYTAALPELQAQTGSSIPIVRADWFVSKSLSAIRSEGGRYYEFIGIQRLSLSDYLSSRGASESQVLNLRSQERAALFRSGITGKGRRIDVFYGSGVRPSTGIPIIAITHDPGDADTDAGADPLRNLRDFRDKAQEVIVVRSNGWQEYSLWNAAGVLQEVAPPDVAVDHQIPAPYTKQLQPAIGCIRCHGPDDGWKPFKSSIRKMLASGLDVFGDLSSGDTTPGVLGELASQYGGDLSEPLRISRNALQKLIFTATGVGVAHASEAVAQIYANYNYTPVTPLIAYMELGAVLEPIKDSENIEEVAARALRTIIRPIAADATGVSSEDPIIGALKAGIGISRPQWEAIYADALTRTTNAQ